jgi:hypothetical protein
MPSKPKTKKVAAPLGDRVVPACDFDIMTGEPVDRNPYKHEMEGTPVLDGPDDKHVDKRPTVQGVMETEYPEVLRHPEPVVVQMAILRELIRMRGCE